MSEEADDNILVSKVRDGAVDAYDVLVERHRSYVCRIVAKNLSADYSEEVAQDVFIEAYQSLHTYRGDGKFRSWLATIAVRTCYAYLRKKYRNREIAVSQLTEQGRDWCRDVLGQAASDAYDNEQRKKQATEVLEWAMSQLNPEERMIVNLIHLEERSVKQVAKDLDWSVAKVKIRAFRARKTLKSLFEKYDEEVR